jgi:hypothetical protein
VYLYVLYTNTWRSNERSLQLEVPTRHTRLTVQTFLLPVFFQCMCVLVLVNIELYSTSGTPNIFWR